MGEDEAAAIIEAREAPCTVMGVDTDRAGDSGLSVGDRTVERLDG